MDIQSDASEVIIAFVEPYKIMESTTYRHYNAGYVIYAKGEFVEFELSQRGRDLDEWSIQEVPPIGCIGVLLWEGECENKSSMHLEEWEPQLSGIWRKPTPQELLLILPKDKNETQLHN